MRDEILAVLPELINERGEFRLGDLVARLNPDDDLRRRWAVEKALVRLANRTSEVEAVKTSSRSGAYRMRRKDISDEDLGVGHPSPPPR